MGMRAPGLVVHEGRNALVTDALRTSILFAAPAWLVAKTLAGRCAEVVEGQAESRIETASWPESRSSWLRQNPAGMPFDTLRYSGRSSSGELRDFRYSGNCSNAFVAIGWE
jgi:hypothetical protein